jgi:hypothetical protein
MSELDRLVGEARDADPGKRIEYRDAIAAHGAAALEVMADWLTDPRLGAFAIRVVRRVGRDAASRPATLEMLRQVDREELPPHLARDVDAAIGELIGLDPPRRSRSGPATGSIVGIPGQTGRGYWVMRTSPWEPAFVWSEARAGRLRQGWGSDEEQNLEVIADAIERGVPLTEQQRYARRSLRMMTGLPGSMKQDDLILTPNLPHYGRLSVFRLIGEYRWEPAAQHPRGERFGHVLPTEMLAADIGRHAPEVSEALRGILMVQTRLYRIDGYGGDVERLLGRTVGGNRWGALWTDHEYETLFGRFPPDGERPPERDIALLAAELGRTADAIAWQWSDGAAYVQGRSAMTTSEQLKAWLERNGSLRR